MRDLLDYLQELVMRLITRTPHLTSSNVFLHKLAYRKFLYKMADGWLISRYISCHFLASYGLIVKTNTISKTTRICSAVGRKMLPMSFKDLWRFFKFQYSACFPQGLPVNQGCQSTSRVYLSSGSSMWFIYCTCILDRNLRIVSSR